MIRAFQGLHRATKKPEPLEEAKRIGKASDWFLGDTGAYRDDAKWSHLLVEADLELYRATQDESLLERAKRNGAHLYAEWKKAPPKELITEAGIARALWLLADATTPQGKAFWTQADRVGK